MTSVSYEDDLYQPTQDGKVLLIEENYNVFRFFKVFGLYVICYDQNLKKYRMSQGLFMVVRFCWFLFHFSGWLFGFFLRKAVEQHSTQAINDCLMASILLLVFIIVDPIQTIIMRRSLEILPNLLNNEVKHLEKLTQVKFGHAPGKLGLFLWDEKIKMTQPLYNSNVEDGVDSNTEYVSKWNFIYTWEPIITISTFLAVCLILFIVGFNIEAQWTEIQHESTLVVMCFYLVFPMLSTWFCVVFIEYERQLYKVIDNQITDEDFIDEHKIKDISDYLETMQVLFKKIADNFFKFVFGMNSLIFVISGIFCMFELLDSFDNARKFFGGFGEIFYAIPLAACVFHIFIICKFSHSLVSGQHEKLRMRLKRLMTSLLMEGKDKPMKKIEMLYKNLKDWPPQAEIYGGYKINYQILAGMVLFIISYARVFKGILVPIPEDLQTTLSLTTPETSTQSVMPMVT
ncbi:unnamed protein product [Meganyctiphanes norvegica]|uniref:Gustatory receptor n=1 Tax=Meganyctiphanes norvegica TaxID=48144 RepID=A0AAV2REX1_MEGNR